MTHLIIALATALVPIVGLVNSGARLQIDDLGATVVTAVYEWDQHGSNVVQEGRNVLSAPLEPGYSWTSDRVMCPNSAMVAFQDGAVATYIAPEGKCWVRIPVDEGRSVGP